MKFIQISCREINTIDTRQTQAVLRHRPEAILFEAPSDRPALSLPYNKYPPRKKPVHLVYAHQKMLGEVARSTPWVASDIDVYNNIMKLWNEGHDVKLYNIDGPSELLQESLKQGWNKTAEPYRRGVHFPWWVAMYLRERIMADNVLTLMQTLAQMETVLVFLQKFHWLHVQYLLQKPTREKIFKYYFEKFPVTTTTINEAVTELHNKTLIKYWNKYSDFI